MAGSNAEKRYESNAKSGKADFGDKLDCLREELYTQITKNKMQSLLTGVAMEEFREIKKQIAAHEMGEDEDHEVSREKRKNEHMFLVRPTTPISDISDN